MLNNNRVQRYNKKMTLKREKTKKSQMPEGRWDFYINMQERQQEHFLLQR